MVKNEELPSTISKSQMFSLLLFMDVEVYFESHQEEQSSSFSHGHLLTTKTDNNRSGWDQNYNYRGMGQEKLDQNLKNERPVAQELLRGLVYYGGYQN